MLCFSKSSTKNCTISTRIPNSGVRCKNDSSRLTESDKKSDCDSTQKPLTPGDSETDSTTATLLKTVCSYLFRRTFFTTWRTVCEKEHCFGFRKYKFSLQSPMLLILPTNQRSNNRSKIPTYNRLKLFNSFQKYHIFSNISRFWTYNEVEFSPKARNYLWLEYKLSLQTSVKPRLLYDVIKTSTETRSS